MKKIIFICTIVFTVVMSSCVKNSSEYKTLQAEKDSLALVNAQSAAELDQILGLLNEVEDNFNSIKAAENYLSVQSNSSGELTSSTRERIQNDMKFVTETLDKNRKQIADLEKRLKASNFNSSKLSTTLKNLQAELEEKTASLLALSDELAKRDQQIAELSSHVTNLSNDVQALKTQTDAQKATIDQQQTELNTVYYCFGTSKELKDQKIVVSNQLGTDFNKDYFIKVKDLNELRTIPLLAKKGKLVSKHPEGSYEFTKDANGQVELKILNPQNFWSLTKYLVVQVNV
jgi:predicted  nucleic acid-binding Zn-ribbon protein